MKSRICKLFVLLMMALVLTGGLTTPAKAHVSVEQPTIAVSTGISEIVPHADQIVIYTRTHNGKRQYRRWNETRGYWVDPDWIDM